MSKLTLTRFMRKVKNVNIETKKHYEFAQYKGERFPVLMSIGQTVNIKKAYKRYKENEKENKERQERM